MTEQNRGQHSKQAANPTKRLVRDAEEQASEQGDRMSILVAIGTRPEAIKMIPVIRALQQSEDFFPIVISTGQHEELVVELFREAGMRIGIVMSSTLLGMAFGGYVSGAIYDWTQSYKMAFLNGLAWNLVNLAIVCWLMLKARGRVQPA